MHHVCRGSAYIALTGFYMLNVCDMYTAWTASALIVAGLAALAWHLHSRDHIRDQQLRSCANCHLLRTLKHEVLCNKAVADALAARSGRVNHIIVNC